MPTRQKPTYTFVRQSGTRPILLKANASAGKLERASEFLSVQ